MCEWLPCWLLYMEHNHTEAQSSSGLLKESPRAWVEAQSHWE